MYIMHRRSTALLAILTVLMMTGCGAGEAQPATPNNGSSVLLSEVTGEQNDTGDAQDAETAEAGAQDEAAQQAEETASSPAAADAAGAEEGPKEYTDDAYVDSLVLSDYIELADYAAMEYQTQKAEITDDDVQAQIDYIVDQNSSFEPVEDRDEARSGDRAVIDFEGKMNGETFEGGSAQGYGLVLGSGNFIDGFEDAIIGRKVGETFDAELKFPENYKEELAGKDVTFTITVNAIEQLVRPEYNDELVAGFGLQDSDGNAITDTAGFEAFVRTRMEELEDEEYRDALRSELILFLEDNSEFKKDPPAALAARLKDTIAGSYKNYAAANGMELEDMLEAMGMTTEAYEADISDTSLKFAKQLMLTAYLAEKEGITLTDAVIEEHAAQDAEENGVSPEAFKAQQDMRSYAEQLLGTMAVDAVIGRVAGE